MLKCIISFYLHAFIQVYKLEILVQLYTEHCNNIESFCDYINNHSAMICYNAQYILLYMGVLYIQLKIYFWLILYKVLDGNQHTMHANLR